MTCIVAIKHNKKIYMGGDSLGSTPHMSKVVRLDEKVFIKDDMLFGFTSSFRMGQILRYVMKSPERVEGVSDMEYLVAHWIPELIDVFASSGFHGEKSPEDNENTRIGGNFLLGYRGVLYNVESDFQIGIPSDQYDAIGCGADLARGSIFTSKKMGLKEPATILTNALEASEKFSAGVQRPFHLLSL